MSYPSVILMFLNVLLLTGLSLVCNVLYAAVIVLSCAFVARIFNKVSVSVLQHDTHAHILTVYSQFTGIM